MDKIPETRTIDKPAQTVNTYYITEKAKKSPAEVVDFAMVAIFVVLIVAVVATYFVSLNVSTMVSLRKITWQALWLWLASFCVGELAKRIFRRKGQKTEEYKKAEEEACNAIKELNESEYGVMAVDYCRFVTKQTIERYRTHQLVTVGISLGEFNEKYLGKGRIYLFGKVLKKELSMLQAKAISRCNRVKTKDYDARFITSYSAEDNSALTPQQWHDTRTAERKDSVRSILFSAGASFGVCSIFYDFFVDFSAMAIFMALVKIIIMATTCALKANFGWNLSVMEINRNRVKVTESKACLTWAKKQEICNRDDCGEL